MCHSERFNFDTERAVATQDETGDGAVWHRVLCCLTQGAVLSDTGCCLTQGAVWHKDLFDIGSCLTQGAGYTWQQNSVWFGSPQSVRGFHLATPEASQGCGTKDCGNPFGEPFPQSLMGFLTELLVRRTWFGQFDELYFVLNWLVMRCKLRPELAADAQQTTWSKMLAKVKSVYFHHPSQGNSTNYYLNLGPRDKAAPPTSQQIN